LNSGAYYGAYYKDALRRSFLGKRLSVWRAARRSRQWTSLDEQAASFYRSILNEGDLCFDIGANIGARTKVFRRLGASVVAVEPQNSCLTILKAANFWDRKVQVVGAACGDQPGRAEIMLCESPLMSSLSSEWTSYMRANERFSGIEWPRMQPCEVTTLDRLIGSYGVPAFIKVDVEGYELQVLRGLSRSVLSLSFEFFAERLQETKLCIERLTDLGFSRFNLSLEESFSFLQNQWVDSHALLPVISALAVFNPSAIGDVYARQ
jgi:FkbM family methyltransferase